ncbi:MAG: hypothetical protein JWR64_2743 [Marmoricola sp.]|nr:hypothetical protein [Marmoricola sp.]
MSSRDLGACAPFKAGVEVDRKAAAFATLPAGYAVCMDDSQNPATKPGPANPQAEGVDAPTPPEGPLRQDKAEGGLPGGHDDEVSGSRTANKSASESGGGTIDLEDEQPDPDTEREERLQEENAETSLDQPSGVGSEG